MCVSVATAELCSGVTSDRSVYSPSRSAMMRTMAGPSRRFTATVVSNAKRRVLVPLPFAPDDAWGHKPSHPVAGSVNGMGVRAVVEAIDDGWAIVLGPAWRRDCGIAPGDEVDVVLYPEGPQRDDLAEDIAAALAAEPDAAAFTTYAPISTRPPARLIVPSHDR